MPSENVQTTGSPEPSKFELMARERNARVIRCNTPDTYSLLDLARNADWVIKSLRNRLLISLEPEQVIPLLTRYKNSIIALSDLLEEMSVVCETEYRTPRGILQMKGEKVPDRIRATGKKASATKVKKSDGNGDKKPVTDSDDKDPVIS